MLFNSFEFAIFLPIVVSVYYMLRLKVQNLWLLCASYLFYGFWDWRFLSLIAISTAVDYLLAQRLHTTRAPQRRKLLLFLSIFVNLGLLGLFKYFNFFVDSFVSLGFQIGLNLDTPALRLLPPVGISFYTFQTLSYTIDVYRKELNPEKDIVTFALFVSFFPQLVAGPIERAGRLLPQLRKQRKVDTETIKDGLLLFCIGLFKKVAIADNAGVAVNRIFSRADEAATITLVAGAFLFTLQIYCDFSGYSNMARGMSRLLGIHLVENFKTPYLSANISEFWRRWHISLSQWLRDYLYIPLGGSRLGQFRTYRNLMLTMLLGGLWHGAAWTFILWGALNGLYLTIHRAWQRSITAKRYRNRSPVAPWLTWALSALLTYMCVTIAFVFFRAETLTQAIAYFQGIYNLQGGLLINDLLRLGLLVVLIAPFEFIQYRNGDRLLAIRRYPILLRTALYLLMTTSLLLNSSNDIPFIYFQF